MKPFNGKILIYTGIAHCLLGISPFAFGKQFSAFSKNYFFKISDGIFEFPLLNGIMNYENFASFWFVYFGILINHVFNCSINWCLYDSFFRHDISYVTTRNIYVLSR